MSDRRLHLFDQWEQLDWKQSVVPSTSADLMLSRKSSERLLWWDGVQRGSWVPLESRNYAARHHYSGEQCTAVRSKVITLEWQQLLWYTGNTGQQWMSHNCITACEFTHDGLTVGSGVVLKLIFVYTLLNSLWFASLTWVWKPFFHRRVRALLTLFNCLIIFASLIAVIGKVIQASHVGSE